MFVSTLFPLSRIFLFSMLLPVLFFLYPNIVQHSGPKNGNIRHAIIHSIFAPVLLCDVAIVHIAQTVKAKRAILIAILTSDPVIVPMIFPMVAHCD